ncbi:hypothetical protein [Planotetraspora kaengkrachanensis]|uniref:hypothetical protein n=1 Tax=Planotetraspora kaengkrachanensis TaxID=575193 RepID=UPI001940D9F9|nr:hypothetical protein [Planotetraspora kaengkrachanensis]
MTKSSWWDSWISSLDERTQDEAIMLRKQLRQLGVEHPDEWVRSEISENQAQVARYRLLRGLWSAEINSWRDKVDTWIANTRRELNRRPTGPFSDGGKALLRLVDELGATQEEIGALARMIAYETVFGVLYQLDDSDITEDDITIPVDLLNELPSWALIEVRGEDGEPTGRTIQGLHESLLSMDPSGRDGRPATRSE